MTPREQAIEIVARRLQSTGTMVPWDTIDESRKRFWRGKATALIDAIAPLLVDARVTRLVEAGKALAEQAAHVRIGAQVPAMNIHGSAMHLGPLVDAWDAALAALQPAADVPT